MTVIMPVRQLATYFNMATTAGMPPVATGGLALGWGDPVYTGGMPPDGTAPCTVIIPTSGIVKAGIVRYPSMQLSFYHSVQGTAAARAEEAYLALKDKVEWTIGGFKVLYINPLQEPFFLTRNADNIYIYAFNISMEIVAV